jgi:hypothetical protein
MKTDNTADHNDVKVLEAFAKDLLEGGAAPRAKGMRFRVNKFGGHYSVQQGRFVPNVQIVCEVMGEGNVPLVEVFRQTISEGNTLTVIDMWRAFNIMVTPS